MELIADYLLFWMNQNSIDDYLDFFGLQKPTDNIVEALTYGAIKNNNFRSFYNIDKGQERIYFEMILSPLILFRPNRKGTELRANGRKFCAKFSQRKISNYSFR